jgi:hypothetical protein
MPFPQLYQLVGAAVSVRGAFGRRKKIGPQISESNMCDGAQLN